MLRARLASFAEPYIAQAQLMAIDETMWLQKAIPITASDNVVPCKEGSILVSQWSAPCLSKHLKITLGLDLL